MARTAPTGAVPRNEAPSAFVHAGRILWRSPARLIGRHEWRMTVYRCAHSGRTMLGYEWRRAAETIMGRRFPPAWRWRPDEEWLRYDDTDGAFAGLPRTLRTLYHVHRADVTHHLARKAPRRRPL